MLLSAFLIWCANSVVFFAWLQCSAKKPNEWNVRSTFMLQVRSTVCEETTLIVCHAYCAMCYTCWLLFPAPVICVFLSVHKEPLRVRPPREQLGSITKQNPEHRYAPDVSLLWEAFHIFPACSGSVQVYGYFQVMYHSSVCYDFCTRLGHSKESIRVPTYSW